MTKVTRKVTVRRGAEKFEVWRLKTIETKGCSEKGKEREKERGEGKGETRASRKRCDRFFAKFVVVFMLVCNEDRVARTKESIGNCQSESYPDDQVSQIDILKKYRWEKESRNKLSLTEWNTLREFLEKFESETRCLFLRSFFLFCFFLFFFFV